MQQLHGELEVAPVEGSGTEIRVTLPVVHDAAVADAGRATTIRAMAQENGKSRGYLLFVWSPTGYSLRELEGDPPPVGHEFEDGRPHARRDEDRRVAVPGRPAPLRLLARPRL